MEESPYTLELTCCFYTHSQLRASERAIRATYNAQRRKQRTMRRQKEKLRRARLKESNHD